MFLVRSGRGNLSVARMEVKKHGFTNSRRWRLLKSHRSVHRQCFGSKMVAWSYTSSIYSRAEDGKVTFTTGSWKWQMTLYLEWNLSCCRWTLRCMRSAIWTMVPNGDTCFKCLNKAFLQGALQVLLAKLGRLRGTSNQMHQDIGPALYVRQRCLGDCQIWVAKSWGNLEWARGFTFILRWLSSMCTLAAVLLWRSIPRRPKIVTKFPLGTCMWTDAGWRRSTKHGTVM